MPWWKTKHQTCCEIYVQCLYRAKLIELVGPLNHRYIAQDPVGKKINSKKGKSENGGQKINSEKGKSEKGGKKRERVEESEHKGGMGKPLRQRLKGPSMPSGNKGLRADRY